MEVVSIINPRRSRKERVSANPNGIQWAKSESGFGKNLLKKMGWSEGVGLGANLQGSSTHIKVSKNFDNLGIGWNDVDAKVKDTWTAQQVGFEDVLKRLNQAYTLPAATSEEKEEEGKKEETKEERKQRKKEEKKKQKELEKQQKEQEEKEEKKKSKKSKKSEESVEDSDSGSDSADSDEDREKHSKSSKINSRFVVGGKRIVYSRWLRAKSGASLSATDMAAILCRKDDSVKKPEDAVVVDAKEEEKKEKMAEKERKREILGQQLAEQFNSSTMSMADYFKNRMDSAPSSSSYDQYDSYRPSFSSFDQPSMSAWSNGAAVEEEWQPAAISPSSSNKKSEFAPPQPFFAPPSFANDDEDGEGKKESKEKKRDKKRKLKDAEAEEQKQKEEEEETQKVQDAEAKRLRKEEKRNRKEEKKRRKEAESQ